MMKCIGCGARTDENTNFCDKCGKKLPKRSFGNALGGFGTAILFIIIFLLCSAAAELSYMGVLVRQNDRIMDSVKSYTKVLYTSSSTEEDIDRALSDIENTVAEEEDGILKKVLEKTNPLTIISGLLTVLVLCLAMRIRRYDPAKTLRVKKINPERILSFLLFGAALNIVIVAILSVIPIPEIMEAEFSEQYSPMVNTDSKLVEIIALAVVTPICEELIFRAVPMTRLRASFGRTGAILLSAILFAAAHYAFNTGSIISVCYAFLAGILFALIFDKFDSVIPCILCHAGFNAVTLFPIGENGAPPFAVTVAAVTVLLICAMKIFSRRPTFSDVVYDPESIEPLDEEEAKIVSRVSEIRKSDDVPDRAELEALGRSWEMKRHGFRLKNDMNDTDNNNNDSKTEE